VILVTNPQSIEHEVTASLASFSHGNGHIFNLSHGITQFAPPENAAAMINALHQQSRQYHTV
jgi:uroporphyrinogen decarboxylase